MQVEELTVFGAENGVVGSTLGLRGGGSSSHTAFDLYAEGKSAMTLLNTSLRLLGSTPLVVQRPEIVLFTDSTIAFSGTSWKVYSDPFGR